MSRLEGPSVDRRWQCGRLEVWAGGDGLHAYAVRAAGVSSAASLPRPCAAAAASEVAAVALLATAQDPPTVFTVYKSSKFQNALVADAVIIHRTKFK